LRVKGYTVSFACICLIGSSGIHCCDIECGYGDDEGDDFLHVIYFLFLLLVKKLN